MKDYGKGKIYIIRNNLNELVYIGSTVQTLSKRMAKHRGIINGCERPLYKAMREYGVSNFYIELLENFSCNNQEELRKREGELIRQYKSNIQGYNIAIAGRTNKEWYEDNKLLVKEKIKQYKKNNPDKIKQIEKKYKDNNKDKEKARKKRYYEQNKTSRNQVFVCECGWSFYKRHRNRHLQSKRHEKKV